MTTKSLQHAAESGEAGVLLGRFGKPCCVIRNNFQNIAKTQRTNYHFPMEKEGPGNELKMARTKLGLSLAEVAHKTGLTNSIISRIENGRVQEPSPSAIKSLCQTYKISVSRIFRSYGWLPSEEDLGVCVFEHVDELCSEDLHLVQETIDHLAAVRRGRRL